MSNKDLIKKLRNASTTCLPCGENYGVYSVGTSSMWEGKCGVCGMSTYVTESRDFAYFITGIRKLTLEDNAPSNSQA